MSTDLCTALGRKAKELVEGMRKRVKRDPDVADYAVAFESVLTDFDSQVVKVLAPSADAVAKEKYYTVEHRSPGTFQHPAWEWIVTGFRDGKLVLQTGHTAEVSEWNASCGNRAAMSKENNHEPHALSGYREKGSGAVAARFISIHYQEISISFLPYFMCFYLGSINQRIANGF